MLIKIIVAIKIKNDGFHYEEGVSESITVFLLDRPHIKKPNDNNKPDIKLVTTFLTI